MPIPELKQNIERRRKLLDAAVELFIEKGYFNTAVRDIISLSGLGTGTFYNYFTDKEDILRVLLEVFAEQIISGINSF